MPSYLNMLNHIETMLIWIELNRVPKTRDRAGEGRCFRSELLPPYLNKAKRLEAVLPWLYLKGVSTNDFDEALTALFGESVKGLSPTTIGRLKRSWEAEYAEWRE